MSSFLQVLKAIKELLPSDPVVYRCVVDFELAIWSAVRSVLADVEVMGCVPLDSSCVYIYMYMTIKVHVTPKFFFG